MEREEQMTFALVEWLGENLFSVVPTVCSRDPTKCKPGVTMDFKWGNSKTKKEKYYKTLILKISKDRKALKDLEDQIVNGEISPDDVTADVIREEENIIDSTTPEKKAIVNTRGGFSGKRQKDAVLAYPLSHTSLDDEFLTPKKAKSSPSSVVNRVSMSGQSSLRVNVACEDSLYDDEIRIKDERIQMLESMLRRQKQKESVLKTKELMSSYMSASPLATPHHEDKKKIQKEIVGQNEELPLDMPASPTGGPEEKKKIPLVEGYSTLITQLQLDEVIDCSGASPTKMIRNLLMVYFPPQTLAKSSCFGGRKFPALDKQIIGACLKFVMKKHPITPRSILVDAINDKCANFRRKRDSEDK